MLGGTRFLGRAVADAALAAGHELTLFNRGTSGPELYPEVERLRGDRDGGLEALAGRTWDAVVDTCGYVPRVVRASAELLRESGLYVFVSSVSVYASLAEPVSESSPVATVENPATEDVEQHYGALKALCEAVVEERFAGRALQVRAGLLAGPHDPTGRFTYWAHRLARGGEVLVPGGPERLLQLVDVRDLGEWIVRSAEAGLAGTFNASSQPFAQRELLDGCGVDAEPVFVDEDWLAEQGVGQWLELPLWIHSGDPAFGRMMEADVSAAQAAGLTIRPLAETAHGALEHASLVDGVGLTPKREAELLAAWRRR